MSRGRKKGSKKLGRRDREKGKEATQVGKDGWERGRREVVGGVQGSVRGKELREQSMAMGKRDGESSSQMDKEASKEEAKR